MKITKQLLKQIITEEIQKIVYENEDEGYKNFQNLLKQKKGYAEMVRTVLTKALQNKFVGDDRDKFQKIMNMNGIYNTNISSEEMKEKIKHILDNIPNNP